MLEARGEAPACIETIGEEHGSPPLGESQRSCIADASARADGPRWQALPGTGEAGLLIALADETADSPGRPG